MKGAARRGQDGGAGNIPWLMLAGTPSGAGRFSGVTSIVRAATKGGVIAEFSSGGPAPISLGLKPDVSAPGVGILSSVPRRDGLWQYFDGTSMAAPHVAGAAALLLERHPTWTVQQVKSALVLTGTPVKGNTRRRHEAPPTREGGGMINLPRADQPLVFARPSSIAFGLLRRGRSVALHVALTDRTRHLIGARELALMRPTAFVINTARGPIVDEGALVDALKTGIIAGAGLDVIGLRSWQLPPDILAAVIAEYPRLGFKREFAAAFRTEAARVPRGRARRSAPTWPAATPPPSGSA